VTGETQNLAIRLAIKMVGPRRLPRIAWTQCQSKRTEQHGPGPGGQVGPASGAGGAGSSPAGGAPIFRAFGSQRGVPGDRSHPELGVTMSPSLGIWGLAAALAACSSPRKISSWSVLAFYSRDRFDRNQKAVRQSHIGWSRAGWRRIRHVTPIDLVDGGEILNVGIVDRCLDEAIE
jgi:hypothetical protein